MQLAAATLLWWAAGSALAAPTTAGDQVQRLLGDLSDGPEGKRNRAAQRLYLLQDPSGNAAVLAMANDPDMSRRAVGVWALSVVRPPTADRVVQKRLSDSAIPVRRAAVLAAGSMRLARAARGLEKALNDADPLTAQLSVRSLGLIGRKGERGLRRALLYGSIEQRLLAVDVLSKNRAKRSTSLLRAATQRGPATARLAAARELIARDDPSGPRVMRQLLRHKDKGIRLQVIGVLARTPGRDAKKLLRRAVKDSDRDVSRAATDALADIPLP